MTPEEKMYKELKLMSGAMTIFISLTRDLDEEAKLNCIANIRRAHEAMKEFDNVRAN